MFIEFIFCIAEHLLVNGLACIQLYWLDAFVEVGTCTVLNFQFSVTQIIESNWVIHDNWEEEVVSVELQRGNARGLGSSR